jgi:acetoin utilization deacetylase AcuC-like enzyme
MTILFTHAACLDHDPGPGHPDSPDRLRAILAALDADHFHALLREEAPLADEATLLLAHSPRHLAEVKRHIPALGWAAIDPDTIVSQGSWQAGLRAVGAVTAAVDRVLEGVADNAFCAVRPPGHHAEATGAMGFCLFNNIAIAAQHARRRHGLDRVAVVDFDVHHGNGTQDIFFQDPGLFFASTHQSGAYPGTGASHERGVAGNIVNLPLPPGSGSAAWRRVFTGQLLPSLKAFAPQLILISAGFDAHEADPLAQMRLKTEDFFWGTQQICAVADEVCQGRVVSSLEGGYDLPALAASVAAHVQALMASPQGIQANLAGKQVLA